MNYNCVIVRYGEMSTKGKNKKDFINLLANSINKALIESKDSYRMVKRHDHIYLYLISEIDGLIDKLKEIQGMYSFSLAYFFEDSDIDNLLDKTLEMIKEENGSTFKVKTRRVDKSYPYTSDDINRKVAGNILSKLDLKVDVHNPEILLGIEIKDDGAYIFTQTIKGLGGYPSGAIGRGLMMLSGGIDSPVASYLLMKRGIELNFIHYASPPYTSYQVIEKLKDILNELLPYQPKINLYIVDFTKLQVAIYDHSFEGYQVTIMRRMMYRIAERLANKLKVYCICNGESVGQVASQTLESMYIINKVVSLPVIRPLATYDKVDIISISKKINTYDISIRPYEDCCTIFPIKKPKTHPKEDDCIKIESKFDYESLIEECLNTIQKETIKI